MTTNTTASQPNAAPSGERHAAAIIGWNDAITEAAAIIYNKISQYDDECGNTDPETGTREYPGEGATWVMEMGELADEIRALKSAAPALPEPAAAQDYALNPLEYMPTMGIRLAYYVRHPDGSHSFADPQPTLLKPEFRAAPQPLAEVSAAQAVPGSGPFTLEQRMPPKDIEVLIYWPCTDGTFEVRVDEWSEIYEDPIGMGGPTICVGEGWVSYGDENVTHWALIAQPTDTICAAVA